METVDPAPQAQPSQIENPPVVQQVEPQLPKSNKGIIIFLVFLVLVLAGTTAYFAFDSMQSRQQNRIGVEESVVVTKTLPPANVSPTQTQELAVSPLVEQILIPADWQTQTAEDYNYGFATTLSLPTGYSFLFSGSEFVLQNDSDATELWDYSTSKFEGKDGIKNYYDGTSRRAWYQKLLNGDFMIEKPATYVPGTIDSVVEHDINGTSYLELTVSGPAPVNYSGTTGVHYMYQQNGMIHIFKPISQKAGTSEAYIPTIIDKILLSLSSSETN